MAQIKGQENSPEKELNEMKASKLPATEFKKMVIRMFKELSENLSSIKKDPARNKGYPKLKEQFTGALFTIGHAAKTGSQSSST